MAKYKIIYNKKDCIGVAACVAVAEKWWVMDEENKADLKGAKLNEETGLYELEVNENELDEALNSAYVCPINVIMIYKQEESGKWIKIAPED